MHDKLDHVVADCTSTELKCIHCLSAIAKGNFDLDPNHVAWDATCPVYMKAVEQFKKDLLFKQ